MDKIDKIISTVRRLNEEGVTVGGGQIAGTVEAGDDPPVNKKRRIYLQGMRKWWRQMTGENK